MNRKVLGLIVVFLAITSIAFASVGVRRDGVMQGTATDLNIVGGYVSSDGSTIVISPGYPSVIATTDSIAATDSGETLIVSPVSNNGGSITLPTAVIGQVFTFIDGKTSGTNTFSVNPYGSETIRYSISGAPLSAGDSITSTGQTGDSVTLICGATGYWYIKDMKGSWTDGN